MKFFVSKLVPGIFATVLAFQPLLFLASTEAATSDTAVFGLSKSIQDAEERKHRDHAKMFANLPLDQQEKQECQWAHLNSDPTVLASSDEYYQVTPNAISAKEIEGIIANKYLVPEESTPIREHGMTYAPPEVVFKLHHAAGYDPFLPAQEKNLIPTSVLKATSKAHRDDPKLTQGHETGMVFLNTNPNAFFRVGEVEVPVVAGTFVRFKGKDVVHNTIVNAGEVHILGAVNLKSLARVISCPNPCCGEGVRFCLKVLRWFALF